MSTTRIETARCNITIADKQGENNPVECQLEHAALQILREYQRRFGMDAKQALVDKIVGYHSARVVGMS